MPVQAVDYHGPEIGEPALDDHLRLPAAGRDARTDDEHGPAQPVPTVAHAKGGLQSSSGICRTWSAS